LIGDYQSGIGKKICFLSTAQKKTLQTFSLPLHNQDLTYEAFTSEVAEEIAILFDAILCVVIKSQVLNLFTAAVNNY
jgi:hypothetical protein